MYIYNLEVFPRTTLLRSLWAHSQSRNHEFHLKKGVSPLSSNTKPANEYFPYLCVRSQLKCTCISGGYGFLHRMSRYQRDWFVSHSLTRHSTLWKRSNEDNVAWPKKANQTEEVLVVVIIFSCRAIGLCNSRSHLCPIFSSLDDCHQEKSSGNLSGRRDLRIRRKMPKSDIFQFWLKH